MKPNRWSTWVILIGIAALLLRLIYLAEIHDSPLLAVLIGDARQYDLWAQDIAAGHWLGSEVFYQTPLYPYFLAVIFKIVGHNLFTVRLIQAVLGALSCLLLGSAARMFFSDRVGLIAASLLALYPPAIFFDGLIQKSALDLILVTALLASLAAFLSLPHRRRWLILAGLILGLLTLNRENARILYPCILIWVLLYFRDQKWSARLGWSAIFTAALLLVLLPVGLRNYHVGGEFLISTSQLGPNLYIGNHHGAQGGYEPLIPEHGSAAFEREDATQLAEAALGRKLSAGEVSDYWVQRSLEFIRGEPFSWLRLMGKKLLLTINAREAVDTESLEAYAEYSWLQSCLSWLSFGLILPLAVLGVWLTRRGWRQLAILYAMTLAIIVAVAVFYVLARYRYPLAPIIVLFAAAAISALPELRQGLKKEWAIGFLLAAIVALPANLLFRESNDVTFLNVGEEFLRRSEPVVAVPLLRKAVEHSPDFAQAHFNLGVALNQQGDKAQAINEFAAALRLQPDYFEAHAALGLTFQEASQPAEALEHFREAVRLRPASAEAHTNLGNALVQSGKLDEAIGQYRTALQVEPANAGAHNSIAVVLQQQGKTQEAIGECNEALRLKPDFAGAHSNLGLALAASGQPDTAILHLKEAVRLEPRNAGMHVNLADLLGEAGREDEAILEYQAAVNLRSDLLESHYRLGQLYAKKGRLGEAVQSFEQALNLAQATQRSEEAQQIAAAINACRAAMK
ncbi:MAG TPA: tetratricopeptide repeat protein [Pyrinomonadaceae bacterium]|nr:tetratricopeptide repeat protein [Pyrinomonadaceae bacterium]